MNLGKLIVRIYLKKKYLKKWKMTNLEVYI